MNLPKRRYERASVRFLHAVVGLCVLTVSLTGCSKGAAGPTETMLTMPASPTPAPTVPSDSPQSEPGQPTSGQEADAGSNPSDHCVIVAGGVTTAMLAPLGFRASSDPDELRSLQQQILELRDKVPADLHDDFTTLAHSVEAPPEGSGVFDEKAFRHAMAPVQDWLRRHCDRS